MLKLETCNLAPISKLGSTLEVSMICRLQHALWGCYRLQILDARIKCTKNCTKERNRNYCFFNCDLPSLQVFRADFPLFLSEASRKRSEQMKLYEVQLRNVTCHSLILIVSPNLSVLTSNTRALADFRMVLLAKANVQ